jgi:hypothetical protein
MNDIRHSLHTGGHPRMCTIQDCRNDADYQFRVVDNGCLHQFDVCKVHADLLKSVRLGPIVFPMIFHEEFVLRPGPWTWDMSLWRYLGEGNSMQTEYFVYPDYSKVGT